MELSVKTKDQQHNVALFGGRLHENKPVQGQLYSNLLYWAHVEAPQAGEFGMHPHEGIEILTFVLEGALEHFDTATNVWTPLPAGGVQLIQAGRGVRHSERYKKGSRAFQIWFDPDFEKSLAKPPYYKDFQADSFTWKTEQGVEVMVYVGENGPIRTDAPGIAARRYRMGKGSRHSLDADLGSYYSLYLLDGDLTVEGERIRNDTFVRISDAEAINIEANGDSDLFVLESPVHVPYSRFAR